MNKSIFVFLISILTITVCFGQETEEQLGREFLDALKSSDIMAIEALIPEPEVIMAFAITVGLNKTDEEKQKMIEQYPSEVRQYIERISVLKEHGKNIGIDWEIAEFEKVAIHSNDITLSEEDQPITVKMTELDVIFSSNKESYLMRVKGIFKYENRWYLAGDRPSIENY